MFAAAEVRGGPKKNFKKSHVTVISPSYPDHPPLEVVIEWVRLATPAPASCDLPVNVWSLIRAWLTECEPPPHFHHHPHPHHHHHHSPLPRGNESDSSCSNYSHSSILAALAGWLCTSFPQRLAGCRLFWGVGGDFAERRRH